jgi:hypothetical protein
MSNADRGKNQAFYRDKKTVNSAVRICVACGNIGVKIDGNSVYCRVCDSKFQIEEACTC